MKRGEARGGRRVGTGPDPFDLIVVTSDRPGMRRYIDRARRTGYRVSVRSPEEEDLRADTGDPAPILLVDAAPGLVAAAGVVSALRAERGGSRKTLLAVRVSPDADTPGELWAAGVDDAVPEAAYPEEIEAALARAERLREARAEVCRMETALRESEERFRLHARATSDSIYDWDLERDVIDWNEHHDDLERIEGASKWWRSRLHRDDRERVVAAFRALTRGGGELWREEFRFQGRGGHCADVSDRAFLLRADDGRPLRLIGAMTDFTERMEAERALRAARDELEVRVDQRTAELFAQVEERKRVEQELVSIGEKERRSIGQDLHDGLCQRLAGILCMTQMLHRRLEDAGAEHAHKVGEIADELDRAIDEAHEISWGLSPLRLGGQDLLPALEHLAAGIESLFDVRCRFSYDRSVRPPDGEAALHVYRIAQEAVSNAVRHGKARAIDITLRERDGRVEAQVRSDGVPFPPAALGGEGMGLKIMAYRAEVIGAEFSVGAGSEGGTVVRCLLPGRKPRVRRPDDPEGSVR